MQPDTDEPWQFQQALQSIDSIVMHDENTDTTTVLYGDNILDAAGFAAQLMPVNPTEPFTARHLQADQDNPITAAIIPSTEESIWYGIVFDPDQINALLSQVFTSRALLPRAIASDLSDNEGIYLRLSSPDNQTLFRSDARYDPYLFTELLIDTDYGGLFEGYTVRASIDPALADRLVIGGLPRTQLPIMILLILLTSVILFITFRVLMKERSLARMRSQFVARVSHELRTPLTQDPDVCRNAASGSQPERGRTEQAAEHHQPGGQAPWASGQ